MIRWADIRYGLRYTPARCALWATASGMILAASVAVLAWPAKRTHEDLVNEVDAQRRVLAMARQASEIGLAYRRASQQVLQLEEKLNANTSQSQLVAELGRLARRSGVHIAALAFEEGRAHVGPYVPLFADVSVQGEYPGIHRLLRDLRELPMWNEVQELRLETVHQRADGVRGQIRLLLFRIHDRDSSSGRST